MKAVVAVIFALALQLVCGGEFARAQQQHKLVFAHYMVCCPRGMIDASGALAREPTVDDFLADIEEADRSGIDGFALNCGEWDAAGAGRYKAHSAKLFEAARRFGPKFRLFFSADHVTAEEAADMVVVYRDHPNQLHHDGRPVLSSFGGKTEWARAVRDKVRERSGGDVFLVPYFFPPSLREVPNSGDLNTLTADSRDIDGYFYFGAAGTPDALAGAIRRHAEAWGRHGKLFMAGITPYYRGLRTNYRIFENHGFDGLVKQWRAAIETNTDWVELVTWNDWSEASYLQALSPAGDKSRWIAMWGHMLAHDGLREANGYFIEWFKTGRQPSVDRERIHYAYRLHRKYALGRSEPGKPASAMPRGVRALLDQINILALLREPAELVIRVGARSHRLRLPAGMHQASVRSSNGDVAFSVERGGTTIGAKAGEFPISATDGWSNFDMLSGVLSIEGHGSQGTPAR